MTISIIFCTSRILHSLLRIHGFFHLFFSRGAAGRPCGIPSPPMSDFLHLISLCKDSAHWAPRPCRITQTQSFILFFPGQPCRATEAGPNRGIRPFILFFSPRRRQSSLEDWLGQPSPSFILFFWPPMLRGIHRRASHADGFPFILFLLRSLLAMSSCMLVHLPALHFILFFPPRRWRSRLEDWLGQPIPFLLMA